MTDELYNAFFARMPKERQNKAMRYVKAEDRKLCAAAFALLDYALRLCGYEVGEYQLCKGEGGKPYFQNLPLSFSLSHTTDAVACAVSSVPIGVDVQKKVAQYQPAMRRACCQNEIDFILASNAPIDDFARLWALKESYAKCIGTGVFGGIDKYDFSSVVKNGGGRAYDHALSVIDCANYALAVCSQNLVNEIKKISLEEL